MTSRRAQYTSIPRSGKSDPVTDSIAANLELLTGQKGKSNKRAVLVEDLQSMGFAEFKNGRLKAIPREKEKPDNGGVAPPDKPVVEKPTRPLNVVGHGGFQYASLEWDDPTYIGHAYAEVFFSSTDLFSSAVRVGVTPASIFSLTLPIDGQGYFWVRFVNSVGDIGPINDASGVHITTVGNIDDLLDKMKGQIDFDQLAPGVSNEINKIPGIDQEVNKIPGIESGLTDIENNVIPGIHQDIANTQDDIKKIVDESIPVLQDSIEKQWEDSDSLASSIIENALGNDYDRENNNARFATIINKQTVLTNDQQSLAQEIKVLVAQFDGFSSEYTNLVKVVATNEESTAQRFTKLDSKIDGVKASIFEDTYTKVQTDSAIASSTQALKSEIEDPNGSSVGANLHRNFYTKTDTDSAITQATQTLRSEYTSGDKKVSDDINADLAKNYYTSAQIDSNHYTKSDVDGAIATSTTSLKSEYKAADKVIGDEVDSVKGDLANNYYNVAAIDNKFYTKTDVDGAIALSSNKLTAEYKAADQKTNDRISGIETGVKDVYTRSEIDQNFYTKADTDSAISQLRTSITSDYQADDNALSNRINGVENGLTNVYTKAHIDTNFYTKTDVDGSIASATQKLEAEYRAADGALSNRIDATDGKLSDYYTKAQIDDNHYTKATADSAIAAANNTLKAEIENPNGSSVGADLANNYYTKVETDKSISGIETSLRSEYQAGDNKNANAIDDVKDDLAQNYTTTADIKQNYYTKAGVDSAISEINTTISSGWQGVTDDLGETAIENALNDDAVQTNDRKTFASITNRQNTFADEMTAMANDYTELKASVGDNSSGLKDLRKVQVDQEQASAQKLSELTSNFNNLSSNLKQNYYTKTDADKALSQVETSLTAEYQKADSAISDRIDNAETDIRNVYTKAEIDQNYYTKADADTAIATADTNLKAEIEDPDGNSLGATVKTTSQAVATVDGYQKALWGVKVSAGDVTASVGLVAKSDPAHPDIDNTLFVIKNADFRVVYDSGTNNDEVTPVFGTIDNPNYDANDPDSPRKVLTINTAYIKVANIKDLITGDLVADSIVSNTTLTSPTIKGGEISIGSNFAVTSSGNMTFNNFTGQAGQLTNRMTVGNGYIDGRTSNYFLYSGGGNFRVSHNGYLYANDGDFRGSIRAGKIIGDVMSGKAVSISQRIYRTSSSWQTVVSASCSTSSSGKNRTISISPVYFLLREKSSGRVTVSVRIVVNGGVVAERSLNFATEDTISLSGGGYIGTSAGNIQLQIHVPIEATAAVSSQRPVFTITPIGSEFN